MVSSAINLTVNSWGQQGPWGPQWSTIPKEIAHSCQWPFYLLAYGNGTATTVPLLYCLCWYCDSPIEVPELASWIMDHPLALGPLFLDSPDVSQIKFCGHVHCSCSLSQLLLLTKYLWCDLMHPPMDLDHTSKVAICVTLFTNEKVWGFLPKLEVQNS